MSLEENALDTRGPLNNLKYNSRCTSSISSHRYRLDIWQRDVPWSSVKQLRTVLETEYSIDDVFGGIIDNFFASTMSSTFSEKVRRDVHTKSEAAKQANIDGRIMFLREQGNDMQRQEGSFLNYVSEMVENLKAG